VNSGRIFTEPRSGEVNILLLFTSISKNNCSILLVLQNVVQIVNIVSDVFREVEGIEVFKMSSRDIVPGNL